MNKEEKRGKDWIELGFQEHEGQWIKTGNRLLEEFKGKYFSAPSVKQRYVVNTIFSLVNLLLPNFVFDRPYIRVRPQQAKYYKPLVDGEFQEVNSIKAARIRQASLNWLYQKIDGVMEQRKAIQDSLFFGFGITKVGYSFETISSPDHDYITKDTPFLKRVNPKDFAWHPLATGLDDSPFFVHRVLTTKEALKKQGKMSKKEIEDIEPEIPKHLKDKLNKKSIKGDMAFDDYVTLYEVEDVEREKILTYVGEEKKLVSKEDNPYDFLGSGYSMIKFSGDVDDFIGIPLLAMVEDEALALNEIVTLIIDHFNKFPGQVFAESETIDADGINRLQNSQQGSIHIVDDVSKIIFQSPLNMGAEYFNIVQLMINLIDRVLGVPDFQRLGGSTRKSATEATFIQGDSQVRREYFLNIVRDFMLNGIVKLGKVQAQFQDKKEEIQASGELDFERFEFDKSDIQGDYIYNFSIDELRASNEAQMNNLNNALQIFASHEVLQPVLRTLSPEKLGTQVFKKLNMDIEEFQEIDSEMRVFVDPEKENDMASEGKPMPQPKKGEDHDYHARIHGKYLQDNGQNAPGVEQILDHLAMTINLKKMEGMSPKPKGSPPAPQTPAQGEPEMAEPEGPVGPLRQARNALEEQ